MDNGSVRHCHHFGRFNRLGVQHDPRSGEKLYLLVCRDCGSTVSTRTLRVRRKHRDAIRLSLMFIG